MKKQPLDRATIGRALGEGCDRKQFLGLLGLGLGTAIGACSPDEGTLGNEGASDETTTATLDSADAADAVLGGGRADAAAGAGITVVRDAQAEARIRRILAAYDSQGIHRTGTEGDLECARWLAEEARAAGGEVDLQELSFPRLDPGDCYVDIGGGRLSGIPVFNAPATNPKGVKGRLGSGGTGAEVGFLSVPANGSGGEGFERLRTGSSERAILAVTGGPAFGLPEGFALLNAEGYPETFGPPAIQLPSESLATLQAAAAEQARVTVVNQWQRTTVTVQNTLATVLGSRPELAPLIVMTPRSGWWRCASERGGGIAVWLEMMRALAGSAPQRTTHFVASTGHELGHWGLDHYLESRQSWFKESVAWIHLGANFGAADSTGVLFQSSEDSGRRLGLDTMQAYGRVPARETLPGERPLGEARNVFDGGGRYLSLLGGNGRFHHPSDRWPEAVNVAAVVDFAAAFSHIAVQLTRGS